MVEQGPWVDVVNAAETAAVRAAEAAESREQLSSETDPFLLYEAQTRQLRGVYGGILLGALGVQLLLTNGIFFAVGRGWLHYDAITLRIFIGATIAQIVGLVVIIVRHLFPASRVARF